jgi:hypothetical protein
VDSKIEKLVSKLYKENEYGFVHQDPDAQPDPELVEHFKKEHNIRTDVHRSCVNCQIRQLSKYKKEFGETTSFKVQCNFIPRGLPSGSLQAIKELSQKSDIPVDRAKKIMLSTIDPAAWAELMFGFDDGDKRWRIRSYQKEQLRCSARRVAVREGRRSGKTFAMALKLLYYAFNMQVQRGRDAQGEQVTLGPDILVVTPYQAQLTNIFEEIESLLKRNIELSKEVTTGTGESLYIKTPTFKMEFKNGSVIKGFVSGMGIKQDGSGGGTIRGQSANVIYLDEMDMIPEDILDKVINPILATTPETVLLSTSTPIGKRAKFYSWCKDREDFKEDYYPSTVLPHWDQIKEEIIAESTSESFDSEYMAEFIEGQYGVFRPSWIHNSRADFEYYEAVDPNIIRAQLGISDPANLITCIGVDWNKNAGTEFYVIGFSPSERKWFALDAKNVPSSEYSAKRWSEELIALNYKWKPSWIYADEGYGHTIIEDLLLHAYHLRGKQVKTPMDLETIKLSDRLKSFNFSKNVILRDPATGEQIKKAGKHFLVENAVRILEQNQFLFPQSDETLTKQLLNYVIVRRSPSTNKPVYGVENHRIGDHRLDAMMLALGGLCLEESVYSGRNMSISIPKFIKPNDNAKDDYVHPDDEARSLMEQADKENFPGVVNILKIVRGGGSREEDRDIKELYKKQGIWPTNTGNTERKRSNVGKSDRTSSILEGLQQNINTPNSGNSIASKPHKRGPRSRSSGRGWKKKNRR